MTTSEEFDIAKNIKEFDRCPPYIQQIIENMLNPSTRNLQTIHNYRQQLDAVRRAIDQAINEHDRRHSPTTFNEHRRAKIQGWRSF